jgi:hypothetical protein
MKLVHGKQCKPDISIVTISNWQNFAYTHPMIGNAGGTKVPGVSFYYLIAVHVEADDECAYAQLIADTILL